MFILYRLTFPRGPVMKRVLQLESNQPAWAEWAWMNPAGLPSRAVYSVWTDFLHPCSFSILFWERQYRNLVSEGAQFGNKLENPAHHLGPRNYSQIALDKRTKSPTPGLWKWRLKLLLTSKGAGSPLRTWFSNIISKCKHWQSYWSSQALLLGLGFYSLFHIRPLWLKNVTAGSEILCWRFPKMADERNAELLWWAASPNVSLKVMDSFYWASEEQLQFVQWWRKEWKYLLLVLAAWNGCQFAMGLTSWAPKSKLRLGTGGWSWACLDISGSNEQTGFKRS